TAAGSKIDSIITTSFIRLLYSLAARGVIGRCFNRRLLAADQVRKQARRAGRKRPAEMTLAGVEVEVVELHAADARHAVGGDRTQSGPWRSAIAIQMLRKGGKHAEQQAEQVLDARRRECRVVAGELRGPSHTQATTQRRDRCV